MIEALLVSLKLSTATTLILLLISIPIAGFLSFSDQRWKYVIEALVLLPILLPPTVLGFYMMMILSPESTAGNLIKSLIGDSLLFSFWGILLGSVVYSLPFGVLPIRDSFSSVDRRYIYTAYTFGYSKPETFIKVVLPNSWEGIITSAVLVFSHTMGEFGVVLMLGGSIPAETKTLSIYIYDEVQALNYSEAHKASLLLLLSSLISLSVVFLLRRRLKVDRG
jgi:molybdate transport system permease protein